MQRAGIPPVDTERPAVGRVGRFHLAGSTLPIGVIQIAVDGLALVANHCCLNFGIARPVTCRLFERGDTLVLFAGGHEIQPVPKSRVGTSTESSSQEQHNPASFQTILQLSLHYDEPSQNLIMLGSQRYRCVKDIQIYP